MPITENKIALRRELLESRKMRDANEKREIEQAILRNLLKSELFKQASTVFTYCSTAVELDTRALMRICLQEGKTLCLPICEQQKGIMTARQITAESELISGRFGIDEPPADAPIISPEQIDLCVVPCLAVDPAGYRLGYGGGYYDRFLPQLIGTTVVLCASDNIISMLPREAFDIPCDMICTERRMLTCETYQT